MRTDGAVILEILLALATLPADYTNTDPVRETAEYRACRDVGSAVAGQVVRIPWTHVRTLPGDIDVVVCVMRGEPDAKPAFLRDTDHIFFALLTRGSTVVEPTVSFDVRMESGRRVRLGPAWIRLQPDAGYSCRIDICELFGDSGDSFESATVRLHDAPDHRSSAAARDRTQPAPPRRLLTRR